MGASMRYLSQRFSAPNRVTMGILNDVGTEELAHLEMVATIVHQLTCGLSMEEIEKSGFASYYVDHTAGIWPQAAGGIPFNACEFQSKGDPLTDLFEDLAAEQKARSTYDNILRLVKTRKWRIPSASSGPGKSSTSSGSGKPSVACRISWTPKTSTPSIHPSMFRLPAPPAAADDPSALFSRTDPLGSAREFYIQACNSKAGGELLHALIDLLPGIVVLVQKIIGKLIDVDIKPQSRPQFLTAAGSLLQKI